MRPEARRWCRWLGRVGYAACAAVYVMVAAIALDAARRFDPKEPRGVVGALHRLGARPGGHILLALLAAGLLAQALWRFVQVGVDLERPHGRRPGLWRRFIHLVVGISYAALFARAVELIFNIRHGVSQKRSIVAAVLEHPLGRLLFFGIGVGLVVFAIVEVVRAWRKSFVDDLDGRALDERGRRTAVIAIGRAGLAGRALFWGAGGIMLARSSLHERADTVGTGDVLRHLMSGPYGQPLAVVAACGLFAFAAYLAVQAAWRKSVTT